MSAPEVFCPGSSLLRKQFAKEIVYSRSSLLLQQLIFALELRIFFVPSVTENFSLRKPRPNASKTPVCLKHIEWTNQRTQSLAVSESRYSLNLRLHREILKREKIWSR